MYIKLEVEDPEAAEALKLLAYFDNQEIWYERLHACVTEGSPMWLQDSLVDQMRFESVMRTLVDCCLVVEVQATTQSYSIHSCMQDRTLAELNKATDHQVCWYAFNRVAAGIDEVDWKSLEQLSYARLIRHAVRLTHHRFREDALLDGSISDHLSDAVWIAELLGQQVQLAAAEQMYERALAGKEEALGAEHSSTLDTLNNLGILYRDQGKLEEAEQMYQQALTGYEKALAAEHTSTLITV